VAGGWPGRAEDDHPVALCDREQPLHVGVALERRQHPLGCRLTDLSLESLELHRREADQRPCSACLGVEGVRHPLGPNANEPAVSERDVSATQKVSSPSRT
jgi:hypothetical protein